MPGTAHLNVINLQVMAEDQIAIDKANGTYEANLASDDKYYLWQGDFQTIPTSMFNNPELYAERLRHSLPEVTTLRLPFNADSFNEDGSLHPQYERFLTAAAAQGFNFIMVQMDGDAQQLTAQGSDAQDQMRDALSGRVYDNLEATWTKMLDWMDAHPAVRDAVYAHEVANEPAAYNTATFYGGSRPAALREFVAMYADHMVRLGQMIDARSVDAKIMVGGWNYSAQFQQLADIAMGDGSALDYIREGLGDSLVWSAHLYPGWLDTGGMSNPDDVRAALDQIYAPILGDALILTETNAQGNEAYNLHSDRPEVQGFVGAYDWFADRGAAIAWFTGSQYGDSNLSRMDPDGTLRFVQQGSYAAAMDAFTLGGEDAAHAGNETVELRLIRAFLRNQTSDPDYEAANPFDVARILGLGVGHGGDDTVQGHADANNFLYGGTGNDSVTGSRNDDFLYGQDGDDVVDGGASGHDHLFGGRGSDKIIAGGGITQMYGGAGGDIFVAHPRGKAIIVDFDPQQGDQLIVNETPFTADDLRARAETVDWDERGQPDLRITLVFGGEIILLGMGNRLDEVAAALLPAAGNVDPLPPINHNDLLRGRYGSDIIRGGLGNDTIYGDPDDGMGNDQLFGEAGNDVLYGVGGNDLLEGGDGNDRLYGGNGNDTLRGGEHHDYIEGGASNDLIYGDNGDDTVLGDGGEDTLYAGGGNDSVNAGDGRDLVMGDGGNDNLGGGNGEDTIYGGNGSDIIYGHESADLLKGDKDNDTLYGGGGEDQLYGGTENDVLYGDDSNDRLFGDSGNDTLNGGTGTDFLSGGTGNDELRGDIGRDTLNGDDGDDSIYGGDMDDFATGGAGNDWLYGEAGNDTLAGGKGYDMLNGGGGADTFVFYLGDQETRVLDMNSKQGDKLRLDSHLLNGPASLAAVLERATLTETGTKLTFDGGDTLMIDNFRGTLTESMVEFC